MNIPNRELEDLYTVLQKKGYRRCAGHYKKESYGYWKSFEISFSEEGNPDSKQIGYQIAVLFIDWDEYPYAAFLHETTGVQFEALLHGLPDMDRMDFSSCGDSLTLEMWEDKVALIYNSLKP